MNLATGKWREYNKSENVNPEIRKIHFNWPTMFTNPAIEKMSGRRFSISHLNKLRNEFPEEIGYLDFGTFTDSWLATVSSSVIRQF